MLGVLLPAGDFTTSEVRERAPITFAHVAKGSLAAAL